jgi:hypothetical protein
MFDDDAKFYKAISCETDCTRLQADLDSVANWCNIWQIKLNINKCSVIAFTKKLSKQISFPYKLGDTLLEHVNIVEDLGVLFETDMSFRQHIYDIVCKANRLLGFIWRNTKDINNVTVFTTLFRSLVLSKVEYCSSVWSPSQANLINKIERVQK